MEIRNRERMAVEHGCLIGEVAAEEAPENGCPRIEFYVFERELIGFMHPAQLGFYVLVFRGSNDEVVIFNSALTSKARDAR